MSAPVPVPVPGRRLEAVGRRALLALAVQTGGRTTLLAVVDLVLIVQGIFAALLWGGTAADFYLLTALPPVVLLAPLALADLIAVEKRSGSLDLTLTLGSREATFLLRAFTFAGLVWLQAAGVMLVVWFTGSVRVPLLGSLCQLGAVSGLAAGAALFWSVHLEGAGVTWLATTGTLAALGKWVFFNPAARTLAGSSGPPWLVLLGSVLETVAVEAGITLLLVAYAMRRLRRAEALLR